MSHIKTIICTQNILIFFVFIVLWENVHDREPCSYQLITIFPKLQIAASFLKASHKLG